MKADAGDRHVGGALDGYRIVDLSFVITGPQATQILADQGAEVIKVEAPGAGDLVRLMGTARGGIGTLFAVLNRSKRSIVVNLREEAGREIVRRLVAEADVFIQNFRPGVIERLGLGEPVLREIRPELIYCSINAFGHTGPDAKRTAFDHVIQGMTGMPRIQGRETGTPTYLKTAFCDKITGYSAAQAITAALLARERGAGGQHLHLSMLDAALSFVWPDAMANHTLLEDDVELRPTMADTYRSLPTADGHVSLAALTDVQWAGLFRALGRPELVTDERFATTEARLAHIPEMIDAVVGGAAAFGTDELLERLAAEDVPSGPLLEPEEIASHRQVVASGTLEESEHPHMGRIRQPRPPVHFSHTPARIQRHAPALGEHTDEVLEDLGFSPAEIRNARAKGFVA